MGEMYLEKIEIKYRNAEEESVPWKRVFSLWVQSHKVDENQQHFMNTIKMECKPIVETREKGINLPSRLDIFLCIKLALK